MTKFVGLRAKTYSYLIDDSSEDKKAKGTKKCVIIRKLKFENYRNCLEATQLENLGVTTPLITPVMGICCPGSFWKDCLIC